MDQQRDKSPFVTDKNGNPLSTNPLKDARVRIAISKMIDRDEIVDKVMEGVAVKAGQLLPFLGVHRNSNQRPMILLAPRSYWQKRGGEMVLG